MSKVNIEQDLLIQHKSIRFLLGIQKKQKDCKKYLNKYSQSIRLLIILAISKNLQINFSMVLTLVDEEVFKKPHVLRENVFC